MAEYTIYLFGLGSELLSRLELSCGSDALAIDEIGAYARVNHKVELWAGSRLVIRAVRPARK